MLSYRSRLLALGFLLGALLQAQSVPNQTTHGVLQAVPVPKGPGSVKVDGVLAEEEWDKRGCMFVYPAAKIRDRYSVEVFALWDKDAFYLGMHFKDPTPMANNVDAENAPYDGWQADGFQARLTTDYGQIHLDAWYSSRKDMTVAALSYDFPLNTTNSKLFRAKDKTLHDNSGFQQAFKTDEDRNGYVQELRIPWALLYRKPPEIKAGLNFRFTGEYYWGTPEAIKWPKVMWSDPINPQMPQRIVVYQNPGVWGTAELLASGDLAKGDVVDVEDDGAKLQGPIPMRVEVPKDAKRFTVAIDDANGRRVRNLASHAEVKTSLVKSASNRKEIEVLWDGRADGGWDKERSLFLGDVVEPGAYTARTLVHGGVGVVHAGSFYNPGTPPWPTDDGTGAWLSDHCPATEVAVMSPQAASNGRILLMAPLAESGVAYIGLNREGRKIWQWTRNTAEMQAIAGGVKHCWFAFKYVGKPCLGRQDPDTGLQVEFANGKQDVPLPGPATGLAVHGNRVAVAIEGKKELLLLDAETAEQTVTLETGPARCLAFTADGKLVGLSENKVFIADPDSRKVETFAVPGIDKPHAVTCDSEGRLYVSDPASQTVKAFSAISTKAKLVQTIGKPGGRPPGPFDPLQMATLRSLAVDERPDGTKHLWAVEGNNTLRRVVVWDLGGKKLLRKPKASVVRDYVGGTGYMGSGGLMSDDIPDLGIYRGVFLKIDYANYDYRPTEVMGGCPDPAPGKVALFRPDCCAYGAYFGNGFHFFSDASGQKVEYYVEGGNLPTVYIRRGGRWHCVAALGNQASGIPVPDGFPQPDKDRPVFCWNDLNGDGYQQPEEVTWANPGNPWAFQNRMWSYRCDRNLVWYHSGLAFRPVRFTGEGAPVYDLSKAEKLPGELGQRMATPQTAGDVYKTRFGYVVQLPKPNYADPHGTIHGLIRLEGYDGQGKLRWTYPAYWHSVHGAFTAPMAIPGVIMGVLKVTNIFPAGDADIIALHGNIGQEFLIRDDGLYVGELFTDQRMAPATLGSDERIAGKPINDTSIGGEPFSGWIGRQTDGKVRYTYGLNDVRIAEVTGLETIQVLPERTLTLTPADIEKCRKFVPKAGEKQKAECLIARGGAFDAETVTFGDEAISIRAGREEVARALLRYDDQRLYVAWQVNDKTPLVNKGDAPAMAFKSGDCVSLLVAPDGQYDRNQLGGTRVLLAQLGDRPVAVVYRPQGPGNAPFVFESPVRKTAFAYVAADTSISFTAKKLADGYILAAAVPWAALQVTPKPGLKLRGDIGTIFGRETANFVDRIVRWVDKQTNVVNDVPTEAEFFPGRWGTFVLE